MLSTYTTPPTQLSSALPRRTDSLFTKQNLASPLVQSKEDAQHARVVLAASVTTDEDKAALRLDDGARAPTHEERTRELTEMLDRMTYWVEELATLLQHAYKNQTELETALTLARSNLQLALANNEMLEEALKRGGGGGQDVGWRRWSEREGVRRSGFKEYVQPVRPNSVQDVPPPPQQQQQQQPSASSRFFSFKSSLQRISSTNTSPTATSTSPPYASESTSPSASTSSLLPPITIPSSSRSQSRASSPAPQVPATAASDPSSSRASSPSPTNTISTTSHTHSAPHSLSHSIQPTPREKELASLLNKERAALKALGNAKTQLEDELESLSQALFEEANKMVSIANRKLAETEEELRVATTQKEALQGALRIVEGENGALRGEGGRKRHKDEQNTADPADERQFTEIDVQQTQAREKGTDALQPDDDNNAKLLPNLAQPSQSPSAYIICPSKPPTTTRPMIPPVTLTVQRPTTADDNVSFWSPVTPLTDSGEAENQDTPRLSSRSIASPSYISSAPAKPSSPDASPTASLHGQGYPHGAPVHRWSVLPATPTSRNAVRSEFENAIRRMRELVGEEEEEEEYSGEPGEGVGKEQEGERVTEGEVVERGRQSDEEAPRTEGGLNSWRT